MNRLLVLSIALGGLIAGPALAAELGARAPAPAPIVSNWTGFYVGADVGARVTDTTWSTTSWTFLGTPCTLNLNCPAAPVGITNFPLASSGNYGGIGARVGGYLGYNWQFAPSWLVGLEGHFGWGDKTVSQAGVAPAPLALVSFGFPPGAADFTSIKTTWDASVRARFGYLVTPDFLVYATGGAAWQHVELSASCGSSCPFSFGATASPTFASMSTTKDGWLVGGGAEWKFWGNWMARAEYTFARFSNIGFNYSYVTVAPAVAATAGGVRYTTNADLDTHTFVVGLAYKFW